MNEWTVRVVLATREQVSDADLDQLADRADVDDATVARRADGRGLVITIDLRHRDALDAAANARVRAERLIGEDAQLVDLRVCTPDIADAEAFSPDTPELLSAPDVAEVLGVSRQRVHQLLMEHPRFPAPYARLGSGPIWSRPAVEHFAAGWTRKPGRPAKAS